MTTRQLLQIDHALNYAKLQQLHNIVVNFDLFADQRPSWNVFNILTNFDRAASFHASSKAGGNMRTKLIREIKAALIECSKPWEICNGKRHTLIKIEGRIIGTVTRNPQDGKDAKNIIAAIRKATT